MTNNQYARQIAEIMCKRFFKTKGYKELPAKFWNDKRFARDYKLQMIRAFALLKEYDGQVILNAINSPDGVKIYSLSAKWLDPILEREKCKLEQKEQQFQQFAQKQTAKESVPITNEMVKPSRESFQPKQSILNNLE